MKQYKYSLSGVLNGEGVKVRRSFHTRNEAIDFMLKKYERTFQDIEIETVEPQTKHDIEYVCNNHSNFRIARI